MLSHTLGRALARLGEQWSIAESYQKFAYCVGGLLIASAVFHTGVLLAGGGSLEGPVSWRKPILFGEAFGLTLVTVAWIMTFLPRRPILGWILMGGLSAANFYEVLWVSVQQWRGVPSHFNLATPFDSAAFFLAGRSIAVTASVILLVTFWSFVSLRGSSSFKWAVRLGLVLLLSSQVIGALMVQNGMAKVVDPQTGRFLPEAVASAAVFGAAGSMKMPHALTLHAVQLLPLLSLLLGVGRWRESRRVAAVLVAFLAYAGLVAVSLRQTFHGLAPLDLDAFTLSLGLVFIGLLLGSFLYALAGRRQPGATLHHHLDRSISTKRTGTRI
jgi:hypothetical protein